MDIGEASKIVPFKSYVIYDLETTTLPSYGIPKITEISAIGVMRDHILNLSIGEPQPRVVNKITLCINPRKIVSLEAERLTGLSNDLLETSSCFNETVFGMLEDFINQLPKPVCLIAHNGNRFDFPILQSEVLHIGKKFGDDLWCADSLPAFRYLYVDQPRESFIGIQSTSENVAQTDEMENLFSQFYELDHVLCEALDSAEKTMQDKSPNMGTMQDTPLVPTAPQRRGSTENEEVKSPVLGSPPRMSTMQKVNETTPSRPIYGQFVPKVAKAYGIANQRSLYTPDPDNGSEKEKRKRKVPVRSLMKEFNDSLVDRPQSFTLGNIYAYACHKEPLTAHSAESDSVMLLQSIVACRSGFLKWVDENAVHFNSIKLLKF